MAAKNEATPIRKKEEKLQGEAVPVRRHRQGRGLHEHRRTRLGVQIFGVKFGAVVGERSRVATPHRQRRARARLSRTIMVLGQKPSKVPRGAIGNLGEHVSVTIPRSAKAAERNKSRRNIHKSFNCNRTCTTCRELFALVEVREKSKIKIRTCRVHALECHHLQKFKG